MKRFAELKNEYEIESLSEYGRILLKKEGKREGKGILKGHKWYCYSLKTDKSIPFGYTKIIVIPQKITEERRKSIKYVVESGVSFKTIIEHGELPHIDSKTGNIHSDEYSVDCLLEELVGQITCCYGGHSGPKVNENWIDDKRDYYNYEINVSYMKGQKVKPKKVETICVPMAAYFPIYASEKEGKLAVQTTHKMYYGNNNKELETILKMIWYKIHDL